jgi:hypothetical protein
MTYLLAKTQQKNFVKSFAGCYSVKLERLQNDYIKATYTLYASNAKKVAFPDKFVFIDKL